VTVKRAAAQALQAAKAEEPGATEELDRLVAEWRRLTGENNQYPSLTHNTFSDPGGGGAATFAGTLPVTVYEQINSYYCGPATTQTILRYLGPQTSQTYDTYYGGYPTLNGSGAHDQPILATHFWLATETYNGTPWGSPYVPWSLNNWRGTPAYSGSAGPGLGGSMTKSDAWGYIDFDMTYGYPIAENIKYDDTLSYIPSGFNPNVTFTHWDVVKGNLIDTVPYPHQTWVYIGQVYHSPGYSYYPNQWVMWDTHWKAIEIHHGIVW
jgi:hypothetical protein